jgi:hypothetical protein
MSAEHIHFFLNLRDQIKLYHWQTHVYARHKATDKILKVLEESIDSFVEVFIGRYGRPKVSGKNAIITLHNITDTGIVRLINSAIKYINGALTKTLKPTDTDLTSIRDDILAELGQLQYLFTLR